MTGNEIERTAVDVDHLADRQLDGWGCKVYCLCGLVFAERYPGYPPPNQESESQRESARVTADARHRRHLETVTAAGPTDRRKSRPQEILRSPKPPPQQIGDPMIQPENGQQPEVTSLPVQVGAAVVQGPDGRPWVALQLQQGVTTYTLALPEAIATELATLIPQVLTEVAAQCRRAKLGLLLPHQVANGAGPGLLNGRGMPTP